MTRRSHGTLLSSAAVQQAGADGATRVAPIDPSVRLERALEAAVGKMTTGDDCPPALGAAIRHAVFPGGQRLRPRLCYEVARAVAGELPAAADCVAVAIELLPCASLVHDDLPCFDDAALRRGRPSVHAAFGEPIAVLVGDALIVAGFESVADLAHVRPAAAGPVLRLLARSVGAPSGLVAGQAWESEPDADLARYHRAKTAAIFEAATMAGALVADGDPAPWQALGRAIGEAYQVADDISDATGSEAAVGKPVGRDRELARPSAVRKLGLAASRELLDAHIAAAVESIPSCRGHERLASLVRATLCAFRPDGPTR